VANVDAIRSGLFVFVLGLVCSSMESGHVQVDIVQLSFSCFFSADYEPRLPSMSQLAKAMKRGGQSVLKEA
jgi:hypothetical protein